MNLKMTKHDVNFVRLHPTYKLADSLSMGAWSAGQDGYVRIHEHRDPVAVTAMDRDENTETLFDEIEFETLMERAYDWRVA